MAKTARKPLAFVAPVKLDFGCGMHPVEGFEGVDVIPFAGVKHVVDLRRAPWPWKDGSVAQAHCSHFVEHLTATERITFANELHRVLVPSGTCTIIVPHWDSCRAYGDPTHQWPPVSEFWCFYLSKEWRAVNAPHTDAAHLPGGFSCNFGSTWGYGLRPDLLVRAREYQQFAIENYKEAAQDLIVTLTRI